MIQYLSLFVKQFILNVYEYQKVCYMTFQLLLEVKQLLLAVARPDSPHIILLQVLSLYPVILYLQV